MTSYLCVTCGTQYPPMEKPPMHCPICDDERQYVGLNGQEWIPIDELRKAHRNVLFEEGEGLWGIHTQPKFAIGQRALLLETAEGGFLWDCVSLIDDETVKLVRQRAGIRAMAISHPHYYTSMVEWSRAFGGIPIYLHDADRQWVQRPDPAIEFWSGDTKKVGGDLTLIRVGGHFDGFQVLHWASGEQGNGVKMTGDMTRCGGGERLGSARIRRPASMPSMPGICQSTNTASYGSPRSAACRTSSIPSCPEGASSTLKLILSNMLDSTSRACGLSSITNSRLPRRSGVTTRFALPSPLPR